MHFYQKIALSHTKNKKINKSCCCALKIKWISIEDYLTRFICCNGYTCVKRSPDCESETNCQDSSVVDQQVWNDRVVSGQDHAVGLRVDI